MFSESLTLDVFITRHLPSEYVQSKANPGQSESENNFHGSSGDEQLVSFQLYILLGNSQLCGCAY